MIPRKNEDENFTELTEYRFKNMTAEEITDYLMTYNVHEKALEGIFLVLDSTGAVTNSYSISPYPDLHHVHLFYHLKGNPLTEKEKADPFGPIEWTSEERICLEGIIEFYKTEHENITRVKGWMLLPGFSNVHLGCELEDIDVENLKFQQITSKYIERENQPHMEYFTKLLSRQPLSDEMIFPTSGCTTQMRNIQKGQGFIGKKLRYIFRERIRTHEVNGEYDKARWIYGASFIEEYHQIRTSKHWSSNACSLKEGESMGFCINSSFDEVENPVFHTGSNKALGIYRIKLPWCNTWKEQTVVGESKEQVQRAIADISWDKHGKIYLQKDIHVEDILEEFGGKYELRKVEE